MENEKVIVRADIRLTHKKALIIWDILSIIGFLIGTFGMSTNVKYNDIEFYKEYDLFFFRFYQHDNYYIVSKYIENEYFSVGNLVLGILTTIVVCILPIIITLNGYFTSKQCRLSLTDKSVTGNKKTLFSNKVLKLPIDKVDAIMASHSFLDTLRGGDTLLIRSASGVIKFPWVQNANDFVKKTLAKIEEYKQSVKNENKNLVSAVLNNTANNSNSDGSSSAARIKELKDLLDSGLITQEEFDSKRKELLNKM